MNNELTGVYYVKNTENGTFQDITTLFDGVRVLEIKGINEQGKAINIYNEQWVNVPSGKEDFMITTLDENEQPVIVRENVDVEITFLVHQKYANNTIDVKTQHDLFINYMTQQDVWIRTAYQNNAIAHCVALDAYQPTTMKLKRDNNANYALGTIKMHCLEKITQE